jgi:hypothetical protein
MPFSGREAEDDYASFGALGFCWALQFSQSSEYLFGSRPIQAVLLKIL